MARIVGQLGISTIAATESQGSPISLKMATPAALSVIAPESINGDAWLEANYGDAWAPVYENGVKVALVAGAVNVVPLIAAAAVRPATSMPQPSEAQFIFQAVQHLS